MKEKDKIAQLRSELAEVGRKAFKRGLVPATSGNISGRVPGTDLVLVKRTGVSLGDAEPSDYVLLDMEGNVLEGGKPSKEVRFHLGLYRARDEVMAVFHLHPPYATSFAVLGRELPVVTAAAEAGLKTIPIVPFAPPGSRELAEYVMEVFEDQSVVAALMARHGIITVGPDVQTAFYRADLLEDTARVGLYVAQLQLAGTGLSGSADGKS